MKTTKPSTKQALNRMNGGHAHALRCLLEGRKFQEGPITAGQIRGWQTVAHTLRWWGAIESGAVTEFGRELLAAWDARMGIKSITAEVL